MSSVSRLSDGSHHFFRSKQLRSLYVPLSCAVASLVFIPTLEQKTCLRCHSTINTRWS